MISTKKYTLCVFSSHRKNSHIYVAFLSRNSTHVSCKDSATFCQFKQIKRMRFFIPKSSNPSNNNRYGVGDMLYVESFFKTSNLFVPSFF